MFIIAFDKCNDLLFRKKVTLLKTFVSYLIHFIKDEIEMELRAYLSNYRRHIKTKPILLLIRLQRLDVVHVSKQSYTYIIYPTSYSILTFISMHSDIV